MTDPMVKAKAKAVCRGVGRRNQEPFKMRLFYSHDDLTSCWAGLVERPVCVVAEAVRPD